VNTPLRLAAPAGGPVEPVLRRLELTITRRLDGLLQGDHLGLVPGPGSERGDAREYHPGDDVRRIDWPVTARTTVPHVRDTVADRELETWVVVDLSASMDFGTAGCEKRDLAAAAVAAVSHLTVRGGNRVGAVLAGPAGVQRVPATAGRAAASALLRRVLAAPRTAPGARGVAGAGVAAGAGIDLSEAIGALSRPVRRRGLAVVVSDFLSDSPWPRALRALGARHDLLAVEVLDPRELELPDVGLLTLVDPETGQLHEVHTSRRRLRERYAAAAAEQRAGIAAGIRSAGAGHLQLRTDRDWLLDVVRFVAARRRGVSAGALR